jgi:hypothetical protein
VRNAVFWTLCIIAVAGAVSAVVATATVTWLYPRQYAAAAPQPAPQATVAQPPVPLTATPVTATPQAAAPAATTQAGQTAMELIRRAAAADLPGALALAGPAITEADLRSQVTRLFPLPVRTAPLPGLEATSPLLVWVDYRREGRQARGVYEVRVGGGKVQNLKGPLAPEGGYAPIALEMQTEQGRPVDLATYKGQGLLLVSPRVPEPGLAETLVQMTAAYGPRGIAVVLVTDIRSPDWVAAARQAGYTGPVWRAKGRLEDVPLVSKGRLLGAYGVLVDREGYAVASLAVLDPLHYDLTDQTPEQIAPTVLQAYGLLP